MLNSGNVLAELAKYGSGMASQEYGNQLNAIKIGGDIAGGRVNTLGNLMQNAQKFGIDTGYYPTGTPNAPKPYGANYNPNQPTGW